MKNNPGFKNVNVINQLGFIVSAAVDTSTITISNVILLLAMHQDVQDKCYEEIKTAWLTTNEDINSNILTQMTYLNMTVKECMRVLTSVPVLVKSSHNDIELGR